MKKVKILLADDHKLLRDGLKLLLSGQSDMQVVGEAGTGEETLRQASQLDPDLILMDLSMPDINGLRVTEFLQRDHPQIRILVLTAHEDQVYFQQACRANVVGYVLKRTAGDDLVRTIRKVLGGTLQFDENLAATALRRQFQLPAAAAGQTPSQHLTPREEEVLRGVALGFTNKELANQLGLSVKTIETHKVRLSEKLHLRSRADIVQFALSKGWLAGPSSVSPLSSC